MKKLILLILLLTSVKGFAQVTETAEFNFNDLNSLNPAVKMVDSDSDQDITTYKFTSGDVKIEFIKGDRPGGARIILLKSEGYVLSVRVTSTMTIKGINGAHLERIEMTGSKGGIYLTADSKGKLDDSNFQKPWISNGETVDSVKFAVSGIETAIRKITVKYTTNSATLSGYAPIDGTSVGSFTGMDVVFNSTMSVENTSGILLTGEGFSQSLTATANGSRIHLAPSQTIVKEGTYTVTIPASCFKNASGYHNAAMTFSFTIKHDNFNYVSVDPAAGNVETLGKNITLTFPSDVGFVEASNFYLKDGNGSNKRFYKATKSGNTVVLEMQNLDGLEDAGTYTLTIPAKSIYDAMYGSDEQTYNPDIVIKYQVTGIIIEDSEMLKKAKELLGLSGIGYPAEGSASRKALAALVNGPTTPSDDDLGIAIQNFYKESDVTLPASGKYYIIKGVNSTTGGLYLSYQDGKVGISAKSSDAAAFKATVNNDGTLTFQTADGKYLHLLTNSSVYEGTSPDNVTDEYTSAVNNLQLEKLLVDDIDAEQQLGLFAIHGSLGKSLVNGQTADAYALLSYTSNTIATDVAFPVSFNENLSSAFTFQETSEPQAPEDPNQVETIQFGYTLAPQTIEPSNELQLTIYNIDELNLNTDLPIYLETSQGAKLQTLTFERDAFLDVYHIAIGDIADGDYLIHLSTGTLTGLYKGKKVQNEEMQIAFTVKKDQTVNPGEDPGDEPGDDPYELPDGFQVIISDYIYVQKKSIETPVTDYSLNEMYIMREDPTYPNPKMQVRLADYDHNNTVATGHFESFKYSVYPTFYAMRLVYDEPIKANSLKRGVYVFNMEVGTFGDANYKRYLDGDTSVKPSDCKINKRVVAYVYVDNAAATFIEGIDADGERPDFYDLTGRKVNSPSRKGVYIVNGKKVVLK